MKSIRYFIWWCTGADLEVLEMCKSEWHRFTIVGTLNFLFSLLLTFEVINLKDVFYDFSFISIVCAIIIGMVYLFFSRYVTACLIGETKESKNTTMKIGLAFAFFTGTFLVLFLLAMNYFFRSDKIAHKSDEIVQSAITAKKKLEECQNLEKSDFYMTYLMSYNDQYCNCSVCTGVSKRQISPCYDSYSNILDVAKNCSCNRCKTLKSIDLKTRVLLLEQSLEEIDKINIEKQWYVSPYDDWVVVIVLLYIQVFSWMLIPNGVYSKALDEVLLQESDRAKKFTLERSRIQRDIDEKMMYAQLDVMTKSIEKWKQTHEGVDVEKYFKN